MSRQVVLKQQFIECLKLGKLRLKVLHVNTTGVGGIMVSNTGSGGVPVATFKNSDTNSTDGTDVGRIDFIGIDSASNDTTYVRILWMKKNSFQIQRNY